MQRQSSYGLEHQGLNHPNAHWNLTPPMIYEHAIRRGEVHLTAAGPFNAITTPHTGRSPKDKFVVKEPTTENDIWWGRVNQPFDPEKFDALEKKMLDYLARQPEIYVRDVYACADPAYRVRTRYISAAAWYQLFLNNLFIRPSDEELATFVPDFTVLHAPQFLADPAVDGTNSSTFIILNFAKKKIIIGGTKYAGELKKAIFTVANYLLPKKSVLSMHCSANMDSDHSSALYFGLSGTGKTTLSADPERALIGDDEHGWSDNGIFNLEGGCYAKVIHLSEEAEPDIFAATHRYGTVLENVVVDPVRRTLELDSEEITENTRSAYPITYYANTVPSGMGGHPKNIVLLTADAWGVMPPIAKLTPEQTMYYFLSGYTAKLAGTERGVTEPQATFSACFGDVFMVWHPTVYAEMLAERMEKHGTDAWLVNTGWTGGPYGVGQRMKIAHTRTMVRAAVGGVLRNVPTTADPVFGVGIPTAIPGIPNGVLHPRQTWPEGDVYDAKAAELAALFHRNFEQFAGRVAPEVLKAGPLVGR